MSWSPEQYLKFEAPRFRPALDLLGRITLAAPQVVYDLGCGTGSACGVMAARWPQAQITGVDDSDAMLAQAAKDLPGLRFIRQGLAGWQPEQPADVIFSNAALHWLPGHGELFPRLMDCLAPGGVLAVQMPYNFAAPSHTLIVDAARNGPWWDRIRPLVKPAPVETPAFYHDTLLPHAAALDIWETEYLQVLTGRDPVKEWTKGTWLRQFLDVLDEPQKSAFEADYARRVAQAYPARGDGRTLFPFRRLFMVAQKPG